MLNFMITGVLWERILLWKAFLKAVGQFCPRPPELLTMGQNYSVAFANDHSPQNMRYSNMSKSSIWCTRISGTKKSGLGLVGYLKKNPGTRRVLPGGNTRKIVYYQPVKSGVRITQKNLVLSQIISSLLKRKTIDTSMLCDP